MNRQGTGRASSALLIAFLIKKLSYQFTGGRPPAPPNAGYAFGGFNMLFVDFVAVQTRNSTFSKVDKLLARLEDQTCKLVVIIIPLRLRSYFMPRLCTD